MTTAYPPHVASMVYVYCDGTKRNDTPCNRLRAIVPSLEQLKGVTLPPCPGCNKIATY
jgi:hypothetical protein